MNKQYQNQKQKWINRGRAEAIKNEIAFLHKLGSCLSHSTVDRLITERLAYLGETK